MHSANRHESCPAKLAFRHLVLHQVVMMSRRYSKRAEYRL